jgi:hypothetical protein
MQPLQRAPRAAKLVSLRSELLAGPTGCTAWLAG